MCCTFNLNEQFGTAYVRNKIVLGNDRVVLLHVIGNSVNILFSFHIYSQ